MGCPSVTMWLQTLCRVLPYLNSIGSDPTVTADPQCPQLSASHELLTAACEGHGLEMSLSRLQLSSLPALRSGSGSALAQFLSSSEGLVLGAALEGPPGEPRNFSTPTLAAVAVALPPHCPTAAVALAVGADSLSVPCPEVLSHTQTGPIAVAFLVYRDGPELLGGGTEGGPGPLNSRVVGAALGTPRGGSDITANGTADASADVIANVTFNVTVNITLRHLTELGPDQYSQCVSWQLQGSRGRWSTRGCVRLGGDSLSSVCACSHFSTFAVLVMLRPLPESRALVLLTQVGLGLSLLCLAMAIVTFGLALARRGIGIGNRIGVTLHLHLSLSLFAAQLLFLSAVSRTQNRLLCSLVAGLLHFLFLSCFSWMFLEGLHLLLRVRNLRALTSGRGRALGGRLLLPVAYGVPAAVVAVSAAVRPQGYGTERHCWLNVERGFLWSFLGPVCTVVAVNLGFFLTTLWTLRAQLSTLNADVTTLKNMRLVTLKALAHLLILGCTWALGLLQGRGLLGAFLFTIVNSLQGAFIFLVHCLLNPQVRELYCRWLRALRCRGHAQATPTTDGQMTSVTTVTTVSSTMDSERPQPHSSEGCSWQK